MLKEYRYNLVTLTPKDAEEEKRFEKFRAEMKQPFVWQCAWLTGAAATMLVIFIVRLTIQRLVILAFELFICLLAWLVFCLDKRFSRNTFALILIAFFVFQQVYMTIVCEILVRVNFESNEEVYILGYVLRLWEAYAACMQFSTPKFWFAILNTLVFSTCYSIVVLRNYDEPWKPLGVGFIGVITILACRHIIIEGELFRFYQWQELEKSSRLV